MIGLVVGLAALLASAGAGRALLTRFAPGVAERPAGWAWALAVGLGAHAAGAVALAATGRLGALTSLLLLLVLAAGWFAPGRRMVPRLPGGAGAAIVPLLLAPALLHVLAPATDTDELYQHLALARRIAAGGALLGGFDTPDGSRPQVVHALFASLFSLGGAEAARAWHLGLAVVVPLAAGELGEARFGPGRGLVPAVVLAGSYSYAHEAGLAYNDVPAAFWLLLGVEGALAGLATPAGLMLGLALATKYTAAPAAAAAGLLLLVRAPRPETFVRAAGAGLLVLAPWWLRNASEGLHPLFPYAGWPAVEGFRFMYPEKYGVGHGWSDALRLPLDVLFRAELDSFVFLGRVSWGWLALGLGALWAGRRSDDARALFLVVLVGFVGWGASAQLMRYLLPLGGVAVLLGASCRGWGPALLLSLLSAPANLGPFWTEARTRWEVVTGLQTEDAFLEAQLPAWEALRYLRDHAPHDERVALLYAWHGYYVEQPYLLGSVEEHTPTRQWLATHGDASLRALQERGVRWLLVGDARFLRKAYAFLPEPVWREQFVEPAESLRALLERDAQRLHVGARWEVYRLDAAPVRE